MTVAKSGWTVYCTEDASCVIESLPPRLKNLAIDFCCELAARGGTAVDAGLPPPGHPTDGAGVHYDLVVEGAPMFVDYVVLPDIKEFRITDVVWAK